MTRLMPGPPSTIQLLSGIRGRIRKYFGRIIDLLFKPPKKARRMLATLTLCVLTMTACAERVKVPSTDCGKLCTIQLDTVAHLGSESDSIWPNPFVTAVQAPNGSFFVGGTDHPGTFMIYGPDGSLKTTFGRSGRGPGEYSAYLALWFRTPGDSVVVVDQDANRFAVLDTNGKPVRTTNIAHRVYDIISVGDKTLLQASIVTPERRAYVLHEWVHDSLGAPHIEVSPYRGEFDVVRSVTTSANGGFWLERPGAYAIDLYGPDFQVIKTIHPKLSWFPDGDGIPKGSQERPAPGIADMRETSDSLLWVIVTIADKDWTPHKIGTVTMSSINQDRDYVLEVIQPATGKRLGTRYFSNSIFFGRGDGLLYERTEGEHGQPMLVAYRPRFSGRHQ